MSACSKEKHLFISIRQSLYAYWECLEICGFVVYKLSAWSASQHCCVRRLRLSDKELPIKERIIMSTL